MKLSLRLFVACALLLLCAPLVFAIPGISDYMPTQSGQYVFYRDYTFTKEAYVGFLFYDDYTFAVRYFSPQAESGSKNIELLVSFNPEKDVIELSGEKVLTAVTADDVDTVNYLHELLYELAAKRKSVNGRDFKSTVRSTEDFYQFGGNVVMEYESFVPIFNLRRIVGNTGKSIFELVQIGMIYSADDTAFSDFKGIAAVPPENSSAVSTSSSKKWVKKTKIECDGFSFKLDKDWTQAEENVWTLGDDALLITDIVSVNPADFANVPYTPLDYFSRVLNISESNNAPDFAVMKMTRTADSLKVNNVFYAAESGETMRDCKYVLKLDDTTYAMILLSVYAPVYDARPQYFESILSSLKATRTKAAKTTSSKK